MLLQASGSAHSLDEGQQNGKPQPASIEVRLCKLGSLAFLVICHPIMTWTRASVLFTHRKVCRCDCICHWNLETHVRPKMHHCLATDSTTNPDLGQHVSVSCAKDLAFPWLELQPYGWLPCSLRRCQLWHIRTQRAPLTYSKGRQLAWSSQNPATRPPHPQPPPPLRLLKPCHMLQHQLTPSQRGLPPHQLR